MKYFIAIILLTISCSKTNYQEPDYAKTARGIITKVTQEIEKKENIQLIGTGSGMMHNVNMLSLSFVSDRTLSVDESRTVMTSCVQILLDAVNSSKELRPYLSNYPFEAKNIKIMIIFREKEDPVKNDGEIVLISQTDGLLKWRAHSGPHQLKTVYEESYTEALQKVELLNLKSLKAA